MEHIKNLTPKKETICSTEQPPTLTIEPLPQKIIARVFKVLKSIYGSAFVSRFDTEDDVTEGRVLWAQKLHDVTPDEIKYAFEIIGQTHPTFPPNVLEFHKLCKSYKAAHASHREFISLPVKKSEKQTVKKYLNEIKKAIK